MDKRPKSMLYINIIALNILNNHFVHTTCSPVTAHPQKMSDLAQWSIQSPLFILTHLGSYSAGLALKQIYAY